MTEKSILETEESDTVPNFRARITQRVKNIKSEDSDSNMGTRTVWQEGGRFGSVTKWYP